MKWWSCITILTPLFLKIESRSCYLFFNNSIAVAKRTCKQNLTPTLHFNFGGNNLQNDDTYEKAQVHHSKPCSAMPAMACLALARQGKRMHALCGERCWIQPSQAALAPNSIQRRLSFSKLNQQIAAWGISGQQPLCELQGCRTGSGGLGCIEYNTLQYATPPLQTQPHFLSEQPTPHTLL